MDRHRDSSTPQSSPGADRPGEITETPAQCSGNMAMVVAYDGAPFQGWQTQPHGPTVQQELERALLTALRHPIKLHGSGRTDTGVHALNQIASFRTPEPVHLRKLQRMLNGLAAPSIAVKALFPVSDSFHARHSATGKIYRYHLFNRPYPPVFARNRCWWIKSLLDIGAMREAAACLLGEHDFSAFRARNCEAASPVRNMRGLTIVAGEWEDSTVRIELEASGFLQHMARIIVGTLVAVGKGRMTASEIPRVLAGADREQAGITAPGRGLHLVQVHYDLSRYPEMAQAGLDCCAESRAPGSNRGR